MDRQQPHPYGARPRPRPFELRLPDGAVNPYLLQAVIIAAGLSGIRSKADPGKRHDIDMYAEGHTITDAPKLPLNMLDAMRAYDADEGLKADGRGILARYLKMKMQEWNDSHPISANGKKTTRSISKPVAYVCHFALNRRYS